MLDVHMFKTSTCHQNAIFVTFWNWLDYQIQKICQNTTFLLKYALYIVLYCNSIKFQKKCQSNVWKICIRLNKKTKTYLIFAVEPVRNPDLGPEAPRGVPAGDSIMILEKIIEIPLRLRLQYKLTTLGKKLLMHFYKIWVLQLYLALRYDFIHTLFLKYIFI